MKINLKLIGGTVASILVLSASAQKAKVVSAYNYNKSYERDKDCSELVKGIESIEAAANSESTNKYAKTWYYGGNLYFNAALSQDKDCAAKFPNALSKTFDFYLNAMKYNIEDKAAHTIDFDNEEDQKRFIAYLDDKKTEFDEIAYYRDIILNKFPYLANAFVNRGVEAFQAGDFEKAKELSLKSVATNAYLGKVDSLGIYNAALSSERLEQDKEALELYSKLADINYGGGAIYIYMANIHHNNGDMDKKIAVIQKGLEAYPDDADLIKEELSFLLKDGNTEEAMKKFDKAIESDPENASLWYNRGYINDQKGNVEAAAADYQKALDLDPTFFDAAYNLGAMYYNLGVEWNNKAANYGLNETEKYKVATKKAGDYFVLARPALEKAHALDPEDRNTKLSLVQIYAIQGEDVLWKEMKAKVK